MTAGYAGNILQINLTECSVNILDTEQYEEFGGGHGMGAALFWEFCRDKVISGFHPDNVVTVMTGPLSSTLTPGAGRTEISGINVFSYPIEWFSRSNIGGFFGTMLKYAGWDGIVIEGRADKPVWINILNDKVTIEDAGELWGLDIIATQDEIWHRVTGRAGFSKWLQLDNTYTVQGPSVLCIGRGGESLSRMGTVQSGIGMSAGQGGFGGVWGAKNLKAISVLGTGGIRVADIKTLLATHECLREIIEQKPAKIDKGRQASCPGCFQKCKARFQTGGPHDGQCLESIYAAITSDGKYCADIIQAYGLNLNDLTSLEFTDGVYINKLYKAGILGPSKAIDSTPLPMEKFGSVEFVETLCNAISDRAGIGADLAEGLMRAAGKWGRLEQDLASGLLNKPQWGYSWHWSVPCMEQAYGSLMGTRDINEHAFGLNRLWADINRIGYDKLPPEQFAEKMSKKMIPYTDDPLMFDFSWQGMDGHNMKQALATGIYSEHKARFVAWHRHYSKFWIESMLYCDWMWPVFLNASMPDFSGITPEYEPRFFNAVTGKNLTFAESMEMGRRIWNLDRAIWTLQGRHRNLEHFAGFMYTPAGSLAEHLRIFPFNENPLMTVYENGKWRAVILADLYLDKSGVEQWKTNFYKLEGWDPDTGWPTRNTLEELGLKQVADSLENAGRLGSVD